LVLVGLGWVGIVWGCTATHRQTPTTPFHIFLLVSKFSWSSCLCSKTMAFPNAISYTVSKLISSNFNNRIKNNNEIWNFFLKEIRKDTGFYIINIDIWRFERFQDIARAIVSNIQYYFNCRCYSNKNTNKCNIISTSWKDN